MVDGYNDDLCKAMILFFNSLSEKDRRRYAALESIKLGHGGITYIANLFFCDEKTIQRGISDVDDSERMEQERVRLKGGGRTSALNAHEKIDEVFLAVLKDHTAGDPMDEKVKWTNLSKDEISILMKKKGIKVSKNIIKKLFKKHGYVKRKALKKKTTGDSPLRDKQFVKISKLKNEYESSDNPIISIDAKKKELIGNLYRDGKVECLDTIEVYDHDYPHLSEGKVTPYSVYDLKNNECFVNLGTSDDTSDFACDSIKIWWTCVTIFLLLLSRSADSHPQTVEVVSGSLWLLEYCEYAWHVAWRDCCGKIIKALPGNLFIVYCNLRHVDGTCCLGAFNFNAMFNNNTVFSH